jgi:hypothetical protein
MGANVVAFVKALGLTKVDVLGSSIGGFVTQEINACRTEARAPPDTIGHRTAVAKAWRRPSPVSQAAGREFLRRFQLRTKDRDPEVNDKVAPAQRAAIA